MFVYTGGDQVVPNDVRRVRIDKSVKIIPQRAFYGREHLIDVEFHDGIEEIGKWAFGRCILLRSVKLLGVKIIEERAFSFCGLTDVEFGVELETIGTAAFLNCKSLRNIMMPSVTIIGYGAFSNCVQITDLELPEGLETIEQFAFSKCERLSRIAIPLNCVIGRDDVFYNCPKLTTVDLVGGIHNTTASLHLEEWRNEMKGEINRINQVLRDTTSPQKTPIVRYWMESVTRRLDHYKAEHILLLKEATTLLELALWKAKIEEKEEKEFVEGMEAKRAKIDIQSKRNERRIMSGANIVIKNVLPYLELK
ncbi:leucine-rich repeat domain-containing protein [Skeletonema marinoi]|uniref:Leucine-rich repeat domain-containing protein n=1 Tax=Skeletonema marinoi TaxID=267567 RepID=A0AAD9DEF2_9STRA|nr:leucine-rich repeat domain-containing protein [Skeletonema marinoi]